MKKSPTLAVLAVTVLACCPAAAFAQSSVTAGVEAGITVSTLHPENDLDGLSSRWGAAAGIFVGKGITSNIGLQVEALASQRGATFDTGSSTAKIRLTYIDVPVTVRFGNTTGDETHFHVFTGPQFSFKVKARETDSVFGASDIEVADTDFGWTLGAGAERNQWSLSARYTVGLKNINTAESDEPVRNRSFALLLGYRMK